MTDTTTADATAPGTLHPAMLTPGWTDAVLTGALESRYGGSWYWIGEDDTIVSVRVHSTDPDGPVMEDRATHAEFILTYDPAAYPTPYAVETPPATGDHPAPRRVATVNDALLAAASAKVLDTKPGIETSRQIADALAEYDDLAADRRAPMHLADWMPDLDAEATDFILQTALFGEAIYG